MALASNGSRLLCNAPYKKPCTLNPSSSRTLTFTVSATPKKQSSPRTGRFDSKNRRTGPVTTKEQDEGKGMAEMLGDDFTTTAIAVDNNGLAMPKLPGKEPDFWEGPQWDGLGFFVEYMWGFGILFALIACGVAVATYNEGATDFKNTPAYKESIQSRDLLEEPDASTSDVFESNPTEQAPSLD